MTKESPASGLLGCLVFIVGIVLFGYGYTKWPGPMLYKWYREEVMGLEPEEPRIEATGGNEAVGTNTDPINSVPKEQFGTKSFESPEGQFLVSFPADPKYRTENFSFGSVGLEGEMLQRKYYYEKRSGDDAAVYMVEYVDIDGPLLEQIGRDRMIQIGMLSLEQNRGMPIKVRQHEVKIGSVDATEVEYKMSSSESEMILVARICLVDQRFFNIKAIGSANQRSELIKFVESFKLLK